MNRLLILTPDFPPSRGGVARYLFELASEMKDRSHVLTVPQEGASSVEGVDVQRTQLSSSIGWPSWLPAIWAVLKRRSSFDMLIVSHILPFGTVAMINKWVTKKPYTVILHGMDFANTRRIKRKAWIGKKVLEQAHLVVTNTESLAREVQGFAKIKKIQVVYPCLSEELVRLVKAQEPELKKPSGLKLLTVGRLVRRKGHVHVLDALSILKGRGMLDGLRYTIVGDGPLYRELYQHAKELQLGGSVVFVRNAEDDELIRHYRTADIFVMPTEHLGSDIEGFGTVYIEAGAFGLPVIGSELSGVDEAILHQKTGFLVPPASADMLANMIERLIREPKLRHKLGQAGQERAWNTFRRSVQFGKLHDLL